MYRLDDHVFLIKYTGDIMKLLSGFVMIFLLVAEVAFCAGSDIVVRLNKKNMDGKLIASNKNIADFIKDKLGAQFYKLIVDRYTFNSKYFTCDPCVAKPENGEVRCESAFLGFDYQIETVLFANSTTNEMAMCVEFSNEQGSDVSVGGELLKEGQELKMIYYSNGKSVKTTTPCSKVKMYPQGVSDKSQASQRQGGRYPNIVGRWRGSFQAPNKDGKPFTESREILIEYAYPGANSLKFKEEVKLNCGGKDCVFNCTQTNSIVSEFSGEVLLEDGVLNLLQKTTTNPKCTKVGNNVYRLTDRGLEVVRVDAGVITSGVLKKVE